MEALIYKSNGDVEEYTGGDTLSEWQGAIGGGYIEPVTMRDHVMFVDEEGMLKDLPYNEQASILVGFRIRGDALLLPKSRVK